MNPTCTIGDVDVRLEGSDEYCSTKLEMRCLIRCMLMPRGHTYSFSCIRESTLVSYFSLKSSEACGGDVVATFFGKTWSMGELVVRRTFGIASPHSHF